MHSALVKWGGGGADLGRLTRSRGMVNERQAVRWGIPSQLLQWVWGVSGFLWRLQPFRWQRWFSQRERPEQGIATSLVGRGQAPVERGVVFRRRRAVLGWEVRLRSVVDAPVGKSASCAHARSAGSASIVQGGSEAAVRHVPGIIGVQPIVIEPTCVEPAVREQFWLVERRGVAWGEHRAWT